MIVQVGKAIGQGFLLSSLVCVSGAWAYGRKVQSYNHAFPNTLLIDYENQLRIKQPGSVALSDRFELVRSLPQGSKLEMATEAEIAEAFAKSFFKCSVFKLERHLINFAARLGGLPAGVTIDDPTDEELDAVRFTNDNKGVGVAVFELDQCNKNELLFKWRAGEGRTWFAIEPELGVPKGSSRTIRFCFGSSIARPDSTTGSQDVVDKISATIFAGVTQFHYLYSMVLLQNAVNTLLEEK